MTDLLVGNGGQYIAQVVAQLLRPATQQETIIFLQPLVQTQLEEL